MSDTSLAERARSARAICPFLTVQQAAFHLGLGVSTLRKMRAAGRGPRSRMHGHRLCYHIADIEAWSEARARGEDHD
jgi:excisionase family DNA binding protein